MTDSYWEQNLWMIETFLFVGLGEESWRASLEIA